MSKLFNIFIAFFLSLSGIVVPDLNSISPKVTADISIFSEVSYERNSLSESMRDVLDNKTKLIVSETGEKIYFSQIYADEYDYKEDVVISEFAIVDFDSDGENEIFAVLTSSHGLSDKAVILHDMGGTVYSYVYLYGQHRDSIFPDGSILTPVGANSGYHFRIMEFDENQYYTEYIAIGDASFPKDEYAMIQGEEVTMEEFWAYYREVDSQEHVYFYSRD